MKTLLLLTALATATVSPSQAFSGPAFGTVAEAREFCEIAQDPDNPAWLSDPELVGTAGVGGIQAIWSAEETCNGDTVNWMIQTGRLQSEADIKPGEIWYNQLKCAASLIVKADDAAVTSDVLEAEFDGACQPATM